MNPAALIPADVGLNAAIAICVVAFVSGTARGFSGFGSALIFMPLASSIADPRLVAALLLIIDFFSTVSYATAGLITMDAIKFAFVVGPVYGIGVWFGASLFGRASETVFRAICYALIAAAVIFGLPALDGVLR